MSNYRGIGIFQGKKMFLLFAEVLNLCTWQKECVLLRKGLGSGKFGDYAVVGRNYTGWDEFSC